ncbi:uncharacterized protein MYCFIDRAFT_212560 [Pseudocercospora fijiensis CIRAD86]|uniref:Uncharacterized protein n=1 Tax=Pseudocercospora fijiensis (strain CIRAD86) TaxID=383855 RepID=M2YJ94_PSEFD|nr:uncharacterized protein MYCFIDRAFT_212560 [Pseudocercospora fijiensis CIRAD86]EME77795.1 hypothetical protein MYCFIDRAFT_212560 [Pseudocercospora fijiensis CIRAD86]
MRLPQKDLYFNATIANTNAFGQDIIRTAIAWQCRTANDPKTLGSSALLAWCCSHLIFRLLFHVIQKTLTSRQRTSLKLVIHNQ